VSEHYISGGGAVGGVDFIGRAITMKNGYRNDNVLYWWIFLTKDVNRGVDVSGYWFLKAWQSAVAVIK